MTDPARLFDESSDELELALLRAGSEVSAPRGLRERTLGALGLGGAAIVSGAAVGGGVALAAGASGKGAGGLLSLLSFKVATLVASAAVGVAVPVYYLSDKDPAPSAPLSKPRSAVAGRAPRALTPIAPSVAPASASSASAAADPLPIPPAPKPPAEALRAELAQLDAARARLTSGDPEGALRLLDAYARSTPRGRLKLEAEVLRIDALAKSGRSAQAKARARAFVSRYPTSVLAARVRRIAGE